MKVEEVLQKEREKISINTIKLSEFLYGK